MGGGSQPNGGYIGITPLIGSYRFHALIRYPLEKH